MIKSVMFQIPFIVLAGLLALAPIAAAQSPSPTTPKDLTITGTLTSPKYVYFKPDRKGFTAPEAIRLCASQGYAYAIVDGRNVYSLEGDENQLAELADVKVEVTGHVDTDRSAGATYAYRGTLRIMNIGPSAN